MAASKPALLYFNVGGRASATRICMFAAFGKDGWENEMLTFPEFMEEKKKFNAGEASRLLSGGLPQLALPDGMCFGQSMAILQYALAAAEAIGKEKVLFNLWVDTNKPLDVLRAAEAAEYAMECLNKCPQGIDDQAEKKLKREEYAAGPMKNWMGILEKRITGPFLLGDAVCYADYVVMMLVDMIQVGQFDYVEPSYLEQFPNLLAHWKACKESAPVRAYMEAYGEDGGI
eukprot:TRINITY_DN7956_c0_g1_i1.p1 TRINITY_DN7956_c0_g1~~TRINITY_DN7956_c0_g1_i1.p1  ORF type:complete len:230 (+),score=52.34 TRINITY_DN7956_c0_g1_i1:75-764(+)